MNGQVVKRKTGCLRRLFWGFFIFILLSFGLLNWVLYNHAYRFTHTDESLQGEYPQRQVYQIQHASVLPEAGHNYMLRRDEALWSEAVLSFLKEVN